MANAWDNLGEAFRTKGHRAEAINANPRNGNATVMVQRLKVGTTTSRGFQSRLCGSPPREERTARSAQLLHEPGRRSQTTGSLDETETSSERLSRGGVADRNDRGVAQTALR